LKIASGKNKSVSYSITGKEYLSLLPFFLFFTLLTLGVTKNFFFWDTVQLASKHAHWYYENSFKYFMLPDAIDSSHIPSFGILLAIVWKIFDKSLFISHLFILPFLLGIVHQSYKLITHFFHEKNILYVLIIFLLDPTLLSQSILVSPDIVLVFLFLFTLNMILQNNRKNIVLGTIALSLVSMRGMMITVVLFLFDLYSNYTITKDKNWFIKLFKSILAYVPAGILTLTFLLYHYRVKGWIGYHENSPWAACFEKVNLAGFLRNMGILVWRLVDFGRIVLWLVLLTAIIILNKRIRFSNNIKSLFILFLLLVTILPLTMLLHKNLLAHRYLLPLYLVFSLIVCFLVFESMNNRKLKKILFAIIAIGLITGNLWVYPEKISQGWDSTLAHIPYYKLRNQMITYIKQKNLPLSEIGTAFPNSASFKYIDLTNEDFGFAEKDFQKNNFIFYSNVMNDFSDSEIDELKNKWMIEKEYKYLQIKVTLYKKPAGTN